MAIESLLKIIANKYSEMDICECVDAAILNFLDDDWEEFADNEFDWYSEYGTGEAESEVIGMLIKEFQVPEDIVFDFIDRLQVLYPCLQPI